MYVGMYICMFCAVCKEAQRRVFDIFTQCLKKRTDVLLISLRNTQRSVHVRYENLYAIRKEA